MRGLLGILRAMAICATVAGCAAPFGAGPPSGDLRSARQACNDAYPRRIGNYLPHARCVNAAVETYAVPISRNPDLMRLQAEVRATLSEKIDSRRLTVSVGEHRMAEADKLVADAERERAAGNDAAASRHVAAVEAMLR